MGALAVQLTKQDLKETEASFGQLTVAGDRYTPELMALLEH
jgi:hypothetical protein